MIQRSDYPNIPGVPRTTRKTRPSAPCDYLEETDGESYVCNRVGVGDDRAHVRAESCLEQGVLFQELVVYADRLQATGLTVNLACQTSTPGETCTVTGNILLELFQRTKGAQAFTFFSQVRSPRSSTACR